MKRYKSLLKEAKIGYYNIDPVNGVDSNGKTKQFFIMSFELLDDAKIVEKLLTKNNIPHGKLNTKSNYKDMNAELSLPNNLAYTKTLKLLDKTFGED
jgi:hypothetical protein